MTDTSTPLAAREHARAQAQSQAARVRGKPTIPVSAARDVPGDIPRDRLLWDETLEAGAYASRVLERGTRLRLVNLDGDACIQLLMHNADRPEERLNIPDTIKVQWQAYLQEGALLLSGLGRVLASIVRDHAKRHDVLCGASSAAACAQKYGTPGMYGPAPAGRDRLLLAIAKHGLGRRDLGPCINLFQGVRVARDGSLALLPDPRVAGEWVELRAELRVLVSLANTPHVLDPRRVYTSGAVRVLAWRGPVAELDDPVRLSSPERLRAFENSEDYCAGLATRQGGEHAR